MIAVKGRGRGGGGGEGGLISPAGEKRKRRRRRRRRRRRKSRFDSPAIKRKAGGFDWLEKERERCSEGRAQFAPF